ncbi:hypothetical protein [Kingella potus]|uniref:hypothetical protein n=1 Tax=Kingella potus TaxID=265175 RepID=UPI001FCFA324|nr:hypothetical protein [Kingella potus]UOP01972.1 hypothetical protein LVJ84_04065 [Kingella potus]
MQAAHGHAVKNKAGSQILVLHFIVTFQIAAAELYTGRLKTERPVSGCALPRGFAPYGSAPAKNQEPYPHRTLSDGGLKRRNGKIPLAPSGISALLIFLN